MLLKIRPYFREQFNMSVSLWLNSDAVLWEKEDQGEQSGQFILSRVGVILTAQLSANSLELAKSHCLPGTDKF